MNNTVEIYPHGYMSPPDSTSSRDSTYEYPPSSLNYPYNTYQPVNRYGKQGPSLRIVEQPVDIFRFRYMTEMSGTHGCLLGENHKKSKKKTHPGVELCNYNGKALIRCSLVQVHDKNEEHPHRLLVDDKEMDAVREVDSDRGYTVVFSGIGIIHTAKRDVAAELMKRKQVQTAITNAKDFERLKQHCEKQAKNIDLNAVCLRFSAHTIDTDEWICEPVFSNPIYNLKSAMTNELKIVRIDKIQGAAEGREDVYILVEKVTKKNIKVRFFELDDKKVEVWSAKGSFSHSDVHHQYAIVFRTPPYRQTNLTKDVLVQIQLVRPSDGKCSEPVDFTYLANRRYKRKASERLSYTSSLGSGSLSSTDLPLTVTSPLSGVSNVSPNSGYQLADALMDDPSMTTHAFISPLLINQPPPLTGLTGSDVMLSSMEFNKSDLLDQLMREKVDSEELRAFIDNQSDSYMDSYMADVPATDSAPKKSEAKSNLAVDGLKNDDGLTSTTAKLRASRPFAQQLSSMKIDKIKVEEEAEFKKPAPDIQMEDRSMSYLATFNEKDSLLIKKLLQEICAILMPQNKNKQINRELLRDKFVKLMDVRLSNGDTFLHMAIGNKLLPYFEFLVKVMNKMRFIDLLNIQNDEDESLLHTAVLYDHKQLIPLLIKSGCDKNVKDSNGNTALHLAVTNRRLSCLQELIKQYERIPTNEDTMHIHMKNNDGNTAFHIANNIGCTASVVALIKAGADMYALNSTQRLPLTLAVYGNHVNVINALIQHKVNVDAPDGRGYTALQIACGMNADYAYKVAKMLLEAGAKPLKKSFSGETALTMAEGDVEMIKLLYEYIDDIDIAIKDEPAEETFESADDMSLSDTDDDSVAPYVAKIAPLLDASGNWRELVKKLNQNAMLECIEESKSPTTSIFTLLSACEKTYTDDFLITVLTNIGETEAADIILSYV